MTETSPEIVVIDDSRASLTLYEHSVAALDVSLKTFDSPRRGLRHLESHGTDLLFLGNLMRETDGLSLLRRVRALEHHKNTAVVVMSTKDYDQDRAVARDLGALEYLVKPVPSHEIRDVIAKYTGAQPRGT